MSTPFLEPLKALVEQGQMTAAGFCNLDGEDVAIYPPSNRDAIRQVAAVGGVALRRLNMAERLSGRGQLRSISMRGQDGLATTHLVSDEYQLVVIVHDDTPQSKIAALASETAATLVELI